MNYSEDVLKLNPEMAKIKTKKPVKYRNIRTYSTMCQRLFASKREAKRGEELKLLENVGEISDLKYQVKFVLSKAPRVTITIDFSYVANGITIYEDSKGYLTRDFRSKMAWLEQLYGIHVNLT